VTGWTLNGARYYDAHEGRWAQTDTLDAPSGPSNANRYACANNPVNVTDPTGEAIDLGEACVIGAIGGAVTFAVGGAATGSIVGGGVGEVAGFFGGLEGVAVGGCPEGIATQVASGYFDQD
jgi:uncharacterized protein RhaS with RHS repeats